MKLTAGWYVFTFYIYWSVETTRVSKELGFAFQEDDEGNKRLVLIAISEKYFEYFLTVMTALC